MISAISSTAFQEFFNVDLAQLSSAQIENFLDHLRKKSEETEKNQQIQKKELAEQVQRNAEQRRERLQQSLLQSISDADMPDRRKLLDAIEDRKSLRKQELDRTEIKDALDKRIDQRQRDANAQNSLSSDQSVNSFAVLPVVETLTGQTQLRAQNMSAGNPADPLNGSTLPKPSLPQPLHLQSIGCEIFRVSGQDSAQNPLHSAQQNTIPQGTEQSQLHKNAATVGNVAVSSGNSTNSVSHHLAAESSVNSKAVSFAANPIPQDNVESGRNIQMLAAFSEHSTRLASALMKPGQRINGSNNHFTSANEKSTKNGITKKDFTFNPLTLSENPSATGVSNTLNSIILGSVHDASFTEAENVFQSSKSGIPLKEFETQNGNPTPQNGEDFEFLDKLADKLTDTLAKESQTRQQNEDPYIAHQQTQMHKAPRTDDTVYDEAGQRTVLISWDRARLIQRVATACQSAVNQNGTIRMKLHPEELGSVSVKIQIDGKSARIELESENEEARQILLENADQLKERLLAQGMHVESFSVKIAV